MKMGAVKMTSGPDSRFPMTLERPVHHPLWPHARFPGLALAIRGNCNGVRPHLDRALQETGAFFERARRRRGKKGKMEKFFFCARYSSFDAAAAAFLPPQPSL